MQKTNVLLLAILIAIVSCTNTKKEEKSEETAVKEDTIAVGEPKVVISGFESIDELAESVVEALINQDHQDYFSHVMSKEMEMEQAEKIENEEIKEEFLQEYGFSLHEEEEYFNNTVKFFKEKDFDLHDADLENLEYTEYKGGEYEPLELYEVMVPVEGDYEMVIDFTVIKVGGKYYLTSELGV